MYGMLRKYLPETLANIAMTLWYALLIFLIYLFFSLPQAGFRYLNV